MFTLDITNTRGILVLADVTTSLDPGFLLKSKCLYCVQYRTNQISFIMTCIDMIINL